MGRYSEFERVERDFYPTPEAAVLPLLPHLTGISRFSEPFAGDGRLISHLEKHGLECVQASDLEPLVNHVHRSDYVDVDPRRQLADAVITNCPWDRKILHAVIEHFATKLPIWLLIDSNWANTLQAAPYLKMCSHEIAIGRVKWIEGSAGAGKEDASWFRFHAQHTGATQFIARQIKAAA